MEIYLTEHRLLLLDEFRLGRQATEATFNIFITMDDSVLSYSIPRHWFRGFKNRNFNLADETHLGRLFLFSILINL